MNKLIPTILFATALAGCRTPITPETSWNDYARYYSPTGETAAPTTTPAEIREVRSVDAENTVANLQKQGYVLLGKFVIADDTEITRNAVAALTQKLNASAAVWSVENLVAASSALPNPDPGGLDGMDKLQLARMNADRSDLSLADQLITHKHSIWMLGKKNK